MSTNLMSSKNPYIHSNYYNFKRFHRKNSGTLSDEGSEARQKLNQRIENLTKIRNELKEATDSFLGVSTNKKSFDINDFLKILQGGKSYKEFKLDLYFKDFLQSSGFYTYAAMEVNKEKQRRLEKIFPELTYQIGNYFNNPKTSNNASMKKIMLDVINTTFGSSGLGKTRQDQLENLFGKSPDAFASDFLKVWKGRIKNLSGKTMQEYIKNIILKANKKINSERENGRTQEVNYNQLINKFTGAKGSNFKRYLLSMDIEISDEEFIKYYEPLQSRLQEFLTGKYIGINNSAIGGTRGEEIFGAIFYDKEEQIEVEVTGSKSQEINEQKIAKMVNNNINDNSQGNRTQGLKGYNKMARFDLLIKNNQIKNENTGRIIGVQSKNYNDIFNDLNLSGKTSQTLEIFKSNLSTSSIPSFAQKLSQHFGGGIDSDSLGYTIANLIWFSKAGSFNGETYERIEDPDASMLIQELGGAIADFLGVAFTDQFKVIPYFSNGFWLLNNTYLIPTWVIIDELIKIAERKTIEIIDGKAYSTPFTLTLQSSFSSFTASKIDAKKLKRAKKNALAGEQPVSNYSNPGLVEAGKAQGEKVISKIGNAQDIINKMSSIFLKVDLKNELMTSFRF